MGQPAPSGRKDIETLLRSAVASAKWLGAPLSVLVIDVDHFLKLVDTHGRASGGQVVGALAALLDARDDCEWRRSGPDEFVVVLRGVGEVQAARIADALRRDAAALDVPWQPLTVSVGVAGTSDTRTTADQLEADARRALLVAKERGRNRVEAADSLPSLPERATPERPPTPLRSGPVAVVVLPEPQGRGVRRVLELSGLGVLQFDEMAAVRLPDHRGEEPVLLITSLPDVAAVDPALAAWDVAVGDARTAAVVFVTSAEEGASLPAREGSALLGGSPSAEGLLPLVSGLLADAKRVEAHRVPPVRGGFGSPLTSPGTSLTEARVLIVDDEDTSRSALERTLRTIGFDDIQAVPGGEEALAAVAEQPPDLVLLDLEMPRMDGFAVLEALRPLLEGDGFLPVVVVTGDRDREHRQRALSSGAKDFLHKPFDVSELGARVLNLLETRRLHLESSGVRRMLEASVGERTRQLGLAKDEIIFRLARAAEYRDDQTGQHAARVAAAAGVLAAAIGLPRESCDLIRRAAPLHDVGKIGIPDAILLKPGRLTSEESEVMRTHTTIGADLLARSTSEVIEMARVIALSHHERWDGSGYPTGLKGAAIPVPGRIVALADALDALTHERPYKPAYAFDESARRLILEAGAAFDPEVVTGLQTAAFRIRDILLDDADTADRAGRARS